MRRIGKVNLEELSVVKDCTFSPSTEPLAKVEPGEIIEIETWDIVELRF